MNFELNDIIYQKLFISRLPICTSFSRQLILYLTPYPCRVSGIWKV